MQKIFLKQLGIDDIKWYTSRIFSMDQHISISVWNSVYKKFVMGQYIRFSEGNPVYKNSHYGIYRYKYLDIEIFDTI